MIQFVFSLYCFKISTKLQKVHIQLNNDNVFCFSLLTVSNNNYCNSTAMWIVTIRCFSQCYNYQLRIVNFLDIWGEGVRFLRLFRLFCEVLNNRTSVLWFIAGTKIDLRQSQNDCVTQKQGKSMQKRIKAAKYLECSALTNEGLDNIFVEAVRATIKKEAESGYCFPFKCCQWNRYSSKANSKTERNRAFPVPALYSNRKYLRRLLHIYLLLLLLYTRL